MDGFGSIHARLRDNQMTRIVAIGSSNTERGAHSGGCYNWFDWLDVMLQIKYGRKHLMVNAGICGETTEQVKARFERDALSLQPDIMFITLGGNDCNPERALAKDVFKANLVELCGRVKERLPACQIILQTYYSCDLERLDAEGAGDRGRLLLEYMEIVREAAKERGTLLVDNLARWEPLRLTYLDEYRKLMLDGMHVNPLGNMVWGLDLGRLFDGALTPELEKFCETGREYQNLLDNLAES